MEGDSLRYSALDRLHIGYSCKAIVPGPLENITGKRSYVNEGAGMIVNLGDSWGRAFAKTLPQIRLLEWGVVFG